jgi:succinyl-diaminopimelate desuccinylase
MSHHETLALTRHLLALNTINPPGEEAAAIHLVGAVLEEAGFRTRLIELAPGRPNLVARVDGHDGDALALGFTGHLDVVPLGEAPWRVDPFAGEIEGDRLYGRGAADMKSGVAAMVVAACRVARQRRRRAGIELVLTAGEEIGCAGAHAVVRTPDTLGRVGALVVGEPTNLRPRVGHRGVLWVRMRFSGRTAHASMPHEGDNAVLKAARAAILLDGHDFGVVHSALGRPTLNVGRLEGGLNLNSVPDSAVLGIDLRLVPGQSSGAVLAELARLLPDAALEPLVDCPPLWSDPGGAWLQDVTERAAMVTGRPAGELGPVPFATDAGYLTPAYGDPPTVILGPGATEEAHKTDEWCSTTRIEQAVELYADLAAVWCSDPLSRA